MPYQDPERKLVLLECNISIYTDCFPVVGRHSWKTHLKKTNINFDILFVLIEKVLYLYISVLETPVGYKA